MQDSADMLDLSDEEIMNMSSPPVVETQTPDAEPEQEEPETESNEAEDQPQEEEQVSEEAGSEEGEDDSSILEQDDEALNKPIEKPKAKEEKTEEAKAEETEETPAINFEEDYRKIIGTPIKASGKEIVLKSVDEAITLIQKGADYSRRMQKLKPALKVMRMLENNNLMDEAKLSHLIDLDRNDPAAIAKFLSDKKIDPLDLDLEKGAEYKPRNHSVTDAQMAFQTALEDALSTPEGKETVNIIDQTWDKVSQSRVLAEPNIMALITDHRSDGRYDKIVTEIDRLTMLGTIPDNTAFLDAYYAVGNVLEQTGQLKTEKAKVETPAAKETPKAEAPQRRVLTKQTPPPRVKVSNNEAALAAAPTRGTAKKDGFMLKNPLEMSDEEFEKEAGNFRI